ncbi:MAG TPA: glycosyltransferase, partial [Acidimicrobiales bacterium]
RALKRLFLRAVVRLSREVLTISEHSRRTIGRDLGVPPGDVTVLTLPYDDELVAAVEAVRPTVTPLDTALYVGAFLPNKNLDRLVQAFSASRFAATGGRLALVGGDEAEGRRLAAGAAPALGAAIDVRPRCDQDELRRLFASALLLVQPSVEEGFGLPVLEAMSCGLPVCVSDGGALPEVTRGRAPHFPATSVPAMTAALDECAAAAREARAAGRPPIPPTPEELGVVPVAEFDRQVCEVVARRLRK